MSGRGYVAWRGNKRVTVVTEVKVRNNETAGKVGMRMWWRGYCGGEEVGSHGVGEGKREWECRNERKRKGIRRRVRMMWSILVSSSGILT
jgi:hypothetical protein